MHSPTKYFSILSDVVAKGAVKPAFLQQGTMESTGWNTTRGQVCPKQYSTYILITYE